MPAEVAINEAVVLAKRYATEDAAGLVNGILGRIQREAARMSAANESLCQRAGARSSGCARSSTGSSRLAAGGDVDAAVDDLAEIAEIAKEIEAEIQRARQAADAGA